MGGEGCREFFPSGGGAGAIFQINTQLCFNQIISNDLRQQRKYTPERANSQDSESVKLQNVECKYNAFLRLQWGLISHTCFCKIKCNEDISTFNQINDSAFEIIEWAARVEGPNKSWTTWTKQKIYVVI